MIKLLIINHIKLIKSASFWIPFIFLIFFLSFVPAAFVDPSPPISDTLTEKTIILKTQIIASIIITSLLIVIINSFSECFVKIKNSLIYKNIKLSDKPKFQFYISTIVPIITYSILFFVFSIFLTFLLDSTGSISGSTFNRQKNILKWNEINVLFLFISIFLTVLLGLSISYFFASIIKSLNIYVSFTWAYLFLIFFFGGSSVPIFLIRGENSLEAFTFISYFIPNVWTNFLFINSFSGQIDFKETLEILNIFIPLALSILLILGTILLKKYTKFAN